MSFSRAPNRYTGRRATHSWAACPFEGGRRMLTRYTGIGLAAFSLAAMGFVAAPCVALAQDNGGQTSTGTENTRRISLDAESMNLYTALELLFREAKIQNYTLDPSLKQNVVTAHLHDVPFNL